MASGPQGTDEEMLDELRGVTFKLFDREVDEHTGLIADKTMPGSPASIAAVGLGLSAYVVALERGLLTRSQAVEKTLKVLRFFTPVHRGQKRTRPDIRASIIIFSTCGRGAGRGNANCRPSEVPQCQFRRQL